MGITISLAWWAMPGIVTTLAILWALFWPVDDRDGYLGGITTAFMLVPALIVSAIAWAIAGGLK